MNVRFRVCVVVAMTAACLIINACSSAPRGTYQNANGFAVLDLKSGGEATFSLMGDASPCTYQADGNKLTLNCKVGGELIFTVNDDGSLTGPPGNFFGALRNQNRKVTTP